MSAVPGPGSLRRWFHRTLRVPLRNGVLIFLALLVVEYLVIPRFVLASKNLHVLSQLNVAWVIVGIFLEAFALFAYAMLTKTLLPEGSPGVSTLLRVDLATTAVAHVVPGGTAASASLGYRLFTQAGISGSDVGFAMATQGMGSAVVLNVLLWIALVVSIPIAGASLSRETTFIYILVALIGVLAILAVGAIVYAFTRGEESAIRAVRAIGGRIPKLGADRLERVVRRLATSLRALADDRAALKRAIKWATANWLFDAAALWAFFAALGRYVDPVELLVAYGVANVLAVIPITPGGLGIVESTSILIMHSFGVATNDATLSILGWRFVNFWLPIPVGAGCYISLRAGRGSGISRRQALASMAAESRGTAPEGFLLRRRLRLPHRAGTAGSEERRETTEQQSDLGETEQRAETITPEDDT